jgi:hypothetical protein
MASEGRRQWGLVVALTLISVAACSSPTNPSASPAGVAQVERPTGASSAPSTVAQLPGSVPTAATTTSVPPAPSGASTLAPSPTSAVSPSGLPAPTSSPSPATAWTQVALPIKQNRPAQALGIVATASGFVAVGSDGDAAVAWVSGDGFSWQEAAIGRGQVLWAALLRGRVVALGQTPRQMAAAWSSADGQLWSPGPTFDRVHVTPVNGLNGLARAPAGYVAYGVETTESPRVWLWTSTDGRRFAHVPLSSLPRAMDYSYIVGWPGGFLAYSSSTPLWQSPDGRDWRIIRGGPVLDAVVYAQGRFLGIGSTRVWTSRTGRRWRRIATTHIDRNCYVSELAWTGVDYVGVAACDGPAPNNVLFIRSVDGSAWSSETLVGAAAESLPAFALRNGVAVVVDGGPAAWVRTPTPP